MKKLSSLVLAFVWISFISCTSESVTFEPPSEEKMQSLYKDPLTIHDAPRLPGDNSTTRDMQFMVNGAGNLVSAKVVANSKILDGEDECLVEKDEDVIVVGNFKASGETYYVVQADKDCGEGEFFEGNILASDIELLETQSKSEDVDLVFNHFNDKNTAGDGSALEFGEGCVAIRQTIVNNAHNSRVHVPRHQANDTSLECSGECGVAGTVFRNQGKLEANRSLGLEVQGKADYWMINILGTGIKSHSKMENIKVASDGSGTQVIPFPDFVKRNGWSRVNADLTVQGYDETGNPLGDDCEMRLRITSPIVLYFGTEKNIHTIHPAERIIHFDIRAAGVKERIGWIGKDSALLTIDLNGNGLIDDGSELFGEATRLPNGQKAANGYEALKQYDVNQDGFISEKDPVFNKLRLWFDKNMDGLSQPDELYSLKDKGVTKISVHYDSVLEPQQETNELPMGNLALFESRFFGPEQCQQDGCKTYDIFFRTIESLVRNQ